MIDKRLLSIGRLVAFGALLILSGCNGTIGQDGTARVYRLDWEQAAADGDKDAQYNIGNSYCCGRGLTYSTALAIAWLCRAAIQGQVDAQYELANIYGNRLTPSSNSRIVGADYIDIEKSYMWYTVAARLGHQRAFDNREKIGNMMSNQSVMNGKRLAAQWHGYICPTITLKAE